MAPELTVGWTTANDALGAATGRPPWSPSECSRLFSLVAVD